MEYAENLNFYVKLKDDSKYSEIVDIIKSIKINENIIKDCKSNEKIDLAILEYDKDSDSLLKELNINNGKMVILILEKGLDNPLKSSLLKYGMLYFFEKDKPLYDLEFCILNHINNIKYERLNRELSVFLKYQEKTYKIPNSLKFVSPICDHLTRDLAALGIVDKEETMFIRFGIQEMIINAMEHGNLEISFDEKSKLLQEGLNINTIIENKASQKEYKKKRVTIKFILTDKSVTYIIKDEGKGFDVEKFMKGINNPQNLTLEHGRGIILTRNRFNKFYYNKKGNQVTLEILGKNI